MSKHDRAIRTPAIILRRRDMGEADRILTVITPEHGKLDVIAYGARKPLSRKTGHVELFTLADMLINKHKTPATLSQVDMVSAFEPIRNDLTLGAYASYAVELLDSFTQTGDEDLHGLFDLLRDTLARLCVVDDSRLVLRYYEQHLLKLTGFAPELNYCVVTGESVEPNDQFFSFADGGAVSAEVGARQPNLARMSFRALRLLRHLQRSDWQTVAALKLPDDLHRDVEALMLGYLTYTLESQLQSVTFIRRLRKMG